MLPVKNTLTTKYPLLFSKKMKDTVSYFEWNLLSELIVQANVNADVLMNKADLVNGKIPYDQLPENIGGQDIYVGVEAPEEPNNYSIWFKIEL